MKIAVHGRHVIFYVLLAFFLLGAFFYFHSAVTTHIPPQVNIIGGGNSTDDQSSGATNATLGFGALYVVSAPGSTRRNHLEQAAAVTGLQLTIPQQIAWSEQDITRFKWHNQEASRIGAGSIMAWLSHHLVLKAFLESGVETALIFEDDVDWDIRLRTRQVPLAQNAARMLTAANGFEQEYPWSAPANWDLLYLGHCGDYFSELKDGVGVGHHHPNNLTDIPHIVFPDETMPLRGNLHPFTASLLTALNVPERHRILHKSKWPLCTFGYALTRAGAEKILTKVAPPKENLSLDVIAYDDAIKKGCTSRGWLKCYTVNPELFHHMEGKSMIAAAEETEEHHVFRPPVDLAGLSQVKWRKETANIGCGFWSGEFYYEGDANKLAV